MRAVVLWHAGRGLGIRTRVLGRDAVAEPLPAFARVRARCDAGL